MQLRSVRENGNGCIIFFFTLELTSLAYILYFLLPPSSSPFFLGGGGAKRVLPPPHFWIGGGGRPPAPPPTSGASLAGDKFIQSHPGAASGVGANGFDLCVCVCVCLSTQSRYTYCDDMMITPRPRPPGGGGTRGVRHTGMCRSNTNRSLFWEKSLNIGYGFELENP